MRIMDDDEKYDFVMKELFLLFCTFDISLCFKAEVILMSEFLK